MDRKFVSIVGIAVLLLTLAACIQEQASDDPAQLSSQTALTNTREVLYGCIPDKTLLNNLKAQLPYEEAEIIYQSFEGEHILVIWIVDPDLGDVYTAENEVKAAGSAAAAARIIDRASVCVRKYDLLHMTMVGIDYIQWFSGSIHPEDIPQDGDTGSGGGPEDERGAGVSTAPAKPVDLPSPNDCSWQAVRTELESEFSRLGVQAGFYYVRDENGSNVFVHWVLPDGQSPADSLGLLELVADRLTCLYPRPTGISLTVAGEDGVVRLTGFLPGSATKRRSTFNLDDLSFQELSVP